MHGQDFLNGCHSKPLTLADLKVGEAFIFFPDDGDDSGHGGFKGGGRIFTKIEPFHPGEGYHESYLNTCREYERPWIITSMPLSAYVLKVHGLPEVGLTKEEAKAIFEWADGMTGCSPENVFCWDGTDSMEEVNDRAAYKIFKACGRTTPDSMEPK